MGIVEEDLDVVMKIRERNVCSEMIGTGCGLEDRWHEGEAGTVCFASLSQQGRSFNAWRVGRGDQMILRT